ncbi:MULTISPECIES: VWA domain-containing protein [Microbacterium]|uniref:VWA domain-containing protein n=1 Tax=Microbacterium TaxID=33882 RepID=UPI00296F083C|nr:MULTISPECIES: SpaA isopeptide-forming pilin-related protein [Microbacterium]
MLSGALIFTGVTPAVAEVVAPPVEQSSTEANPPADETPVETTPPAERIAPVEETPAEPAPAPAEPAPAPADPAPAPAPAPDTEQPAPAEGTEADAATDDQSASRLAAPDAGISLLAAGPDGGVPPYIYWTAVDGGGNLVAGTTFEVQARSGGFGGGWSSGSLTDVADCTTAPCTGYDLDPNAGEFLVKQLDDRSIANNTRYRVAQAAAPAGYQFDDAWRDSNSSGSWSGQTFNFGEFENVLPAPGTITIQKGGLRTGAQTVAGLQGATFEVFKGGSSTTPDTNPANLIGSCVTAANGQCSVPAPPGAQYWIVEKSAPAGWSSIDQLYADDANTPYRFRTDTVTSGSNTTYPKVGTGGGATTSSGYWANVLQNPTALQACGIRVGLLIDLSNSIDSTELGQLKSAANGFVDALQGTPSSLALWTFATSAPASGGANGKLNLTSVSTPAGATTVKNKINGLTQPGGDAGATNWDQGLWQVANDAANKVDVLLMLTDGTPTVYGPSADGPGNYSRFREVETSVFSANAVKNLGTRVVPVGIGVGSAEANIKAISGPAINSDYYLVANYSALAGFLQNLAKGQCDSTINVTKMVVPSGGTIANATPTANWGFSATSGNPVTPGSGSTNASGAISFKVSGLPSGQSAGVTITEENRAGYTLLKQGGKNAVCKNDLGQNVTVTDAGSLGFTANATGGRIVTCTVYNQAPDPQVKLKVVKKWVINGTPYDNDDPARPFGSAALSLTGNPGAVFGTEYTYNVGSTVAIGETVTGLPPFCTNSASGTGNHTMTASPNPNVVTITNTVTCTTKLKLSKKVEGGNALPTLWTLKGTGPGGALTGPTGGGPATSLTNVTPGARYVLSEGAGDARYTQEVAPNATPVAGSTGSWHCYILNADGTRGSEGAGGLNGWVEVQLGQHVDCEAVNQTASLVVLKHVVNDDGGSQSASAWDLTATPAALSGLTATTVDGSETASAANTVQVRPNHVYTISETGPTGYEKVTLQQLVGGTWVDVSGWDVSVPAAGTATYRIVNDDIAPRLTLVKEVTNNDGGTTPNTAWTLTATTEDGPGLSGPTGTSGAVAAGAVYTLSESSNAGYDWASLSCTNGHDTSKGDPTLTLTPGENVTCTFRNDDQPGKLTLLKSVDTSNGGTAAPSDWNQKLTAKRGADATLSFNHNETKTVPAGVYTLAEVNQLTGYEWTNLVCSTGQTSMDLKTVTVPNGTSVTCTFTNRAIKPTLNLVKLVDNKNGTGSATPELWTLTAASAGQPSVTGQGAASGAVMPGKEYVLSESENVSGYTAGDWSCYLTGSSPRVAFPVDDDVVVPVVGKNVTCEITNTAVPAEGGIVKKVSAGSPEQIATGPDAGKWRIVYDITVTNKSRTSTLFYSLSDALQLGAGISATSAAWTGPNGTGDVFAAAGTATLATDVSLAPQTDAAQPLATHVYTVTVIADVAASAAGADTSVCTSTQSKRAFLNSATLTVDGTPTTVQDCAQPVFPTIDKKGTNPASQNADASWNVEYTVTVGNPSDTTAVQATLSDAFPAAPAGWTLAANEWTVTPVGDAPEPAASPYAPGSATIWQGTLPADTSYSYTVTGTLVPSTSATPIGDCTAQGGLRNKATVTSGQIVKDDTGCVSIVQPPVEVFKADGVVTQLADGTWQIDYAIEVQNTSATTATVYTLTDTPDLGDGFTAAGPGTWRDPADHGVEVAAPAANTPIGLKGTADGTHTYVYRVLATFDPEADEPQLECEPGQGGAFHNVAAVAFPGGTDSDDACAEPGAPKVTKTAAAPSPGPGGSWLLSYTVVVENTSGMTLAYTLDDEPWAVPTGVNLTTAWAVSGPVIDPADGGAATLTPGWDGDTQPQLATGTIADDATHTYTVTAGVTLTTGVDPDVLACGESPAENNGIWNTTVVTNGVFEDSAEDCIEVLPVPVEVAKSNGVVSQGEGGVWTIAYTVTVSNPNPLPSVYTLTDTPQFDGSFQILTQGWVGSPDTTDVPIGANATGEAAHTYTYLVTAKSTVDPVPASGLRCTDQGGGFFNVATVSFPGGTDSDSGCGIPVKPAVNKIALPSIQNPVTGEWTLRYAVSVTNTSGLPLWYSAKDTPQPLPAGATGGAWQVLTPTLQGGGTAVVNPLWNGAGVPDLATGNIPHGATHTFTLTRTVMLAASVPDALLDCENADSALWNRTAVTNGIGGNDAAACALVERPAVDIDKSVTGTKQLADGTWEITYDVVVTNTSDELAAVYSLEDALQFGGDIDIADASWIGPNGPGTFEGPAWSATLATDQVLAPLGDGAGEDTYTVTVHATVDADAWDGETLACQEGETPGAGGFLNTATVTVNGEPITDDACTEPELPTFEKVGVSASQDEDDATKWLVTYELRVTGSGFDTFYSLSDTPEFADGISVISGAAQRTDIDPAGPVIPVTAGADFVTDVPLGATDEPHVYTVAWLVDITDTFDPDLAACDGEGTGFFNTALLSIGEIEIPGEHCLPVEDRVYPVPTKTVTSTTQNPETGDWIIVYQIDVELAAEGPLNPNGRSAEYDLVDQLEFGGDINIGSASWTGESEGDFTGPDDPAQLATDKTIDAGETHTYVVRVVASVTADAIEGETTECVRGEVPAAGGFLNTALLSSGGVETPVADCSEPVFPEIEKHGGATTDNGDGTWDIEYYVTVSYPESDADPLPESVAYDLTDAPALPAGVELDGDWSAEAAGEGTPGPTTPSWNGSGTWTVVDGGELTPENGVHTYRVFATVAVTGPPAGEPEVCDETEGSGILIPNVGTITSGDYTADDEGCQVVHFDDVGIEKTAVLGEGQESVEPGDTFSYELTVTNHGTRPTTDVRVTDDDLNDRLDILGLSVSPAEVAWHTAPGWTENGGDQSNDVVDLTLDSLGVGESAVITIEVEFLPYEQEPVLYDHDGNPETPDIEGLPQVVGEDGLPENPEAIDLLENTACVATERDGVEENNCDSAEVPVRDLVALVYTRCVNDAPFLGWTVTKSQSLVSEPIDFLWKPNNADVTPQTSPAQVAITQPGGSTTWSDEIAWPGAVFTPPPSSVSIDYPGWRAIEGSDIVAGSSPTQYYLPGTDVVMTPAQQADYVFNGLILDPSELDFAWRGVTDITFTVNPELQFSTAYPPATPECFVARHTEVQIDKAASVQRTEPGKSFSYTLDVANVSSDSAAEGVVVTDTIPADIRITAVNWPGKGDADAFPNWQSCEVTGQNGEGYGGTLRCVLFGPLQPIGSDNGGASTAPRITLSATVNPSSTANTVTNVAVVDYHTFGNPEDPGRDSDDATVLLSALPATGSGPVLPLLMLGFLALLAGVTALVVTRRRRGEARPTL